MLEKYRGVVAALSAADAEIARRQLSLPEQLPLFHALKMRGLDQAALVLALLHAGRHSAVEMLVGRPILVCPAQPTPVRNLPLPHAVRPGRRIHVRVQGCPLKIPSARARWEIMRRCSTVESYATRVPRWKALRDVREWAREGWLEVAA